MRCPSMSAAPLVAALLAASLGLQADCVTAFTTFPPVTNPHEQIDDRALAPFGFSTTSRDKVDLANRGQDWTLSGNPEHHGDRLQGQTSAQAFDNLRQYIARLKQQILTMVPACNAEDALDSLGCALHAIQDFYSHSNYADELTPAEKQDAKDALNNPASPVPGALKMTSWGVAAGQDPENYRHADNNKDSSERPFYSTAAEAAAAHSADFVESILDSLGSADSLKLANPPPPPPPQPDPLDRSVPPGEMYPGNSYQIQLDLHTDRADGLVVYETLAHGVEFVGASPPPAAMWSYTLDSPEGPAIGALEWYFSATVPLGDVHIEYAVTLTDEALVHPAPGLRCTPPDSSHVIYHGDYIESAVGHMSLRNRIGGDVASPILRTTYVPIGAPGTQRPAPFVRAAPNPMTSSTRVTFGAGDTWPIHLAVYDVGGRLVRTLSTDPQAPGEHTLEWNRRNAAGQEVQAGVYFIRLWSAGRVASTPLIVGSL